MAESVPVRCPACRREHLFAAPSYPCVCGAPVTPPLDRLADPAPVTHRTWDEDWVTVPCDTCGRADQWPHPELGCPCGVMLRIPVRGVRRPLRAEVVPGLGAPADLETEPEPEAAPHTPEPPPPGTAATTPGSPLIPDHLPLPRTTPTPRPVFQPVTIRTARDAVTAAALYLRWLGYRDIRRADQRPPSGIGLAARGMLAQVDPTVRPATLRDVECLWLTAMSESTGCVYFSLAGYADDARGRADALGIPLFVLDLTGTPQPVNTHADELLATGA
ncbi:hypothetical protein ABT255_54615 [Streptomyces mirabilis]|uniref:Restriction endonuclease n=2 Tax=Streptomyces mirabilis TaxID=68239 RepID=A0ABU3UHL1_9ACTN|nr:MULTISPECIES: hypothetical protein [Streptomyces]MCX4612896.1 hypothetical protein [Streptomyces mirabilis]MCX5353026.1 hypothetical protein [Streptomyces mirabilis]MDU8993403.1 hypothetical protein [Streptomyces mirabilis]QDN94412.1 hypothetical protein FNV61_40960 [Streptomyces sp. RLB3-6]QDO14829.1 hypothetical protein FNV68_42040 [Streptomyces sp. S1D4-23]